LLLTQLRGYYKKWLLIVSIKALNRLMNDINQRFWPLNPFGRVFLPYICLSNAMWIWQNLVRDPYIMNSDREHDGCILFNYSRHGLIRNGGNSNFTQIDVRMIKVVQTTWNIYFQLIFYTCNIWLQGFDKWFTPFYKRRVFEEKLILLKKPANGLAYIN
jgi:hypothetical protein